MARKGKIGLDYFPHDTEFDNELEYIIALHKETGYYVYFRLLERLYKVYGYYYPSDKKSLALLANKINVDINTVNVIINDCLSEHLFNKSLHNKYQILTSKGIQKRFFDAIGRRKDTSIIKEYILIDNEYIITLNVNINYLNVDKSTQSKVEESKVEESKAKKRNVFVPPLVDDVKQYFKEKGYTEESAIKAWEYYAVADWYDSRGNKVKNWKQKCSANWFKDENMIMSKGIPF